VSIHSAFSQFATSSLDEIDNNAFADTGKLTAPALAIGADKSPGTAMADDLRFVEVGEIVEPAVISAGRGGARRDGLSVLCAAQALRSGFHLS
jgi:hypothetical protein